MPFVRRIAVFLLLFAFSEMTANAESQINIYVDAQNGSDQKTGISSLAPIQTLTALRKLVQNYILNTPAGVTKIHVSLKGTFSLTSPWTFTADDSGKPNLQIMYQGTYVLPSNTTVAVPGTVISGGTPITFSAASDGTWVASVDPRITFESLYVNGQRAQPATLPVSGYFYTQKPVNCTYSTTSDMTTTCKGSATLGNQSFVPYKVDDVKSLTDAQNASEISLARVLIYDSWEAWTRKVTSVDVNGVVLLDAAGPWPIASNSAGYQRYKILNSSHGFYDQPEPTNIWYLDASHNLHYRPKAGWTLPASAYVPATETLLDIKEASYLTFRNLSFQYAGGTTLYEGIDNQEDSNLPAAVTVNIPPIPGKTCPSFASSSNIIFADDEFAHLGKSALWLGDNTTYDVVNRSYFHDLGGSGIKIGFFVRADRPNPSPCDIVHADSVNGNHNINGNVIHLGGQAYPAAPVITVAASSNNTIQHNDLGGFPGGGIQVGSSLDFCPQSFSTNNTIMSNHIHHLKLGTLSDDGAIYLLGNSSGKLPADAGNNTQGSSIAGNVVHDVFHYPYYGQPSAGLYLEQGSANYQASYNITYNTDLGVFANQASISNYVGNNIVALTTNSAVKEVTTTAISFNAKKFRSCVNGKTVDTLPNYQGYLFLNRNLFYFNEGQLASGSLPAGVKPDSYSSIDYNDYFNSYVGAGSPIFSPSSPGRDIYSHTDDPGFANLNNCQNGNHFCDLSDGFSSHAAGKIGMKAIDMSGVGVDSSWNQFALTDTDGAPTVSISSVINPYKNLPLVSETFEYILPDAKKIPLRMNVSLPTQTQNPGDVAVLEVSIQKAQSGFESLHAHHVPTAPNQAYLPVFEYKTFPNLKSQTTISNSFDIYLPALATDRNQGARLLYQGLDQPMAQAVSATGFKLSLVGGGPATVNGKNLCPILPLNAWIHVKIEIASDAWASPTPVTVTLSKGGNDFATASVAFGSTNFSQLNRLNMIFDPYWNGTTDYYGDYYLDNFVLKTY